MDRIGSELDYNKTKASLRRRQHKPSPLPNQRWIHFIENFSAREVKIFEGSEHRT